MPLRLPSRPRNRHRPQVVNAEPKQTTGQCHPDLAGQSGRADGGPPLAAGDGHHPGHGPGRTPAAVHQPPSRLQGQAEAGIHSSGWPLVIVGDRDGAPMVFVPGGTFTMGNDSGQPAEGPAHKVRMSPYYIDQHEVTVRQFRLFLAETHYRGQPPHSWSEDFRQNPSESLPMVMVNARDAQAYADWALKKCRPRLSGRWRPARPTAASIPGDPSRSSRKAA